uniref:Small heat shock protein Hsp20.6 n=1 Tax=Galeruca daurica TaxID=1651263 RepID=A0A2H4RDI6_9CUCU|nr:small heat shock protein Hsp20.6 [Galeruca daurica]
MAFLPIMFGSNNWGPHGRCVRRPRNDLVGDILTPLAIMQAMFDPENEQESRNMSSTLQQRPASAVTIDKNKFQANFDVQHFKPEEITVRVADNYVTVEAKHEEKQDEHGHIYRHFIRKYKLPDNCDAGRLESRLSTDGVLTVTAPLVGDKTEHRTIPITQTGQPVRLAEKKKPEEEKPME